MPHLELIFLHSESADGCNARPCGQRMYPLQMRSLGYRAIQMQLMELRKLTPHPFAPRKYGRVGCVTSARLCLRVQTPICWDASRPVRSATSRHRARQNHVRP
jgi:hypothetical protein